jgi:hypothetical protein
VTVGAPAMVGKNEGLMALLQKEDEMIENPLLMQYHCIMHQQNLCAKAASLQDVMKVVVKIVNFVRSKGLNHIDFQSFLSETGAEYGDVIYFSDVCWLSRGKMLKRVFNLREPIREFMASKGKLVPEFSDPEWMSDFGYLTDISLHLKNLNLRLQGRDNLVHNLFDHIKSFDTKFQVWELQL